jgi:hypothetical protein
MYQRKRFYTFLSVTMASVFLVPFIIDVTRGTGSSTTPLNSGIALIALSGIWLVLSIRLLRRRKYVYDWYPREKM